MSSLETTRGRNDFAEIATRLSLRDEFYPSARYVAVVLRLRLMVDVSARDLRNRTAALLRRVEAGERLRVNVNRRPVAEIVPLERPRWVSGAVMMRVVRDAPADRQLLDDLSAVRGETVVPR